MFASLHTNSNLLTSLLASHHSKHILIAVAPTLCAFTLNIGQAHTHVHFIHVHRFATRWPCGDAHWFWGRALSSVLCVNGKQRPSILYIHIKH